MTQFISLLSLAMMVISYFLLNRSFKAIYIKIIKTYFFAFACCALIASGLSIYQSKDQWAAPLSTWLHEQIDFDSILAFEKDGELAEGDLSALNELLLKDEVQMDVDVIGQYPELPRGCEVTSLAMLLNYHQIETDKMELAERIKKDPTPFQITDKGAFFGNPNTGFVGNMYSLAHPGYGVYHEPVAELAREYANEKVVDFSGSDFHEVLHHLSDSRPVWVIINTTYDELPEEAFTTWQTPEGEISITRKEHAVVLTGYDDKYVYFNDPIQAKKRKAPIERFEKAWVQMGKQAITIMPS